ncbi:unnamed protein product [Didymodactylos carnosus]|uniref:G-protein coupled receptors family 1 profile domain-containing protein n=1 Tax=Didymodactylos carnosus TaxID=1234261 RepID=A0A815GAJ3_9BILA|nr:unnamed protein product [Didymodactylos carnosus]CAF1336960.1 unnamed protein product [Didymodactylos carnosus]CAF4039145.1 unnamed protein product [Didymodactylos carnosus]CAF4194962.1 unnamed protein product [Didymodactylos carnosus]
MLPRTYILLACIDRYMSSSTNVQRRNFSTKKTAKRLIPLTALFWAVVGVHNLIWYDIQTTNGSRICFNAPGTYALFLSFYSVIVNGLSMPILMALFGFLLLRNLKNNRRQVQPMRMTITRSKQQKDYQLLKMLLFQILVNVILSLPTTIYLFYNGLSQYVAKSSFRLFIENYIYNLTTLLQYTNGAIAFYIYTLTARTFRTELKRFLVKHCTDLQTKLTTQQTLTASETVTRQQQQPQTRRTNGGTAITSF